MAQREAVDGHAEPDLGLDLVALGVGNVTHVVAEAGHAQVLRLVPSAGRPSPGADPGGDPWILPVADDGLAGDPEASLDEPELAVTVGGLVEIHEVHVDLRPRQVAIELRVQVEQRNLERAEAGDPHPRR